MNSILKFVICVALLFGVATAQAQQKREQRAVWMSAYVSDWPSSPITESNANTMKVACQRMLDTLAANNMNAVYYHVRAMCDAMYNSAYEPWSSYIVANRGDVPAFDPLQWIVQEAHKRGIEIYAWVNPYRYSPKSTKWGQSDRDYIHTHPEWLLTTDYETVLNPGIPEVRQRVVDVCQDIISKYDVDGLVFDDYFYNQGGCDFSLDADLYNAYQNGGGTLSQGDWRRENVNQMVADVNAMIKQIKPWVRFGIGPAGVACSSPAVAEKYGVEPSPGSDWQYNQIYSDPMAWVTRGTIDFISPQVYWNTTGNFDEVTNWWGKIGKRFNRHVYISQSCSSFGNEGWDLAEFVKQVNVMRDAGAQGMVYFKYSTWRNNNGTINGKIGAYAAGSKSRCSPLLRLAQAPSGLLHRSSMALWQTAAVRATPSNGTLLTMCAMLFMPFPTAWTMRRSAAKCNICSASPIPIATTSRKLTPLDIALLSPFSTVGKTSLHQCLQAASRVRLKSPSSPAQPTVPLCLCSPTSLGAPTAPSTPWKCLVMRLAKMLWHISKCPTPLWQSPKSQVSHLAPTIGECRRAV